MPGIQDLLKAWAKAYLEAAENPELLLADPSEKTSEICAKRCQILKEAEENLRKAHVPGICPTLDNLFAAEKDMGCISCLLSSGQADHPDCTTKNARYFDSYRALVDLATELLQ